MSTYKNHIKAINRLHEESLSSFVSLSELHDRLKIISDDYDLKWQSQNTFEINPWSFSKTHVIFGVNERIQLAKMIFPNEQSNFEEKYHIPPLSEYLLLTCIDRLGQPEEWLTFDNWLVSKSKKIERQSIIQNLNFNQNIDFTLEIYKEYQSIYGVRNSFFGFFKNLMQNDQKIAFFSHLEIEVFENYPNNMTWNSGTELSKIKYLFSIRNNFTHRTRSTGPYALLWPEHIGKDGWYEKEKIYGKPITQKVKVTANYYNELENILKAGIWEFIKQEVNNTESKNKN